VHPKVRRLPSFASSGRTRGFAMATVPTVASR
jgi:hypothetical protein